MKFIVYLLTLFMVGTAVAQNPTILQGNYITNVFGQSNFVLNPNARTDVLNVTNATRSTTTPLVATSEFTLSLTSGTNATWTLRAFDQGMKGQNCEARFSYRGFATATTKAELVQNSLVVASLTLTPSTDPRIASINFPCGDLVNLTTFRIAQTTANMTGTNEIGGIYVGLATNQANVAQAEIVVQAARNSTQSISGLTTTILWNNETTDTYGEYDPTTGIFTAKRAGVYEVNATAMINAAAIPTNARVDFIIWKNTTTIDNQLEMQQVASTRFWKLRNSATMNVNVGDQIKVTIAGSGGFGTFDIYNDVLSEYNKLSIKRFPTSSELVVTPERQNTFGGVSYAGNTDFTGTSTSAANISASNFGTATFHGKAVANGTGSCGGSSTDYGFCLENVPPGTYQIAANFQGLIVSTVAPASRFCSYNIKVTTSGGTEDVATSIVYANSSSSNNAGTPSVGILKLTSQQSYVRLNVQYASGSGDTCLVRSSTSSNAPSKPSLQFSPLDQPSNSALYVQGPVLAAATGAAIPAGYQGEEIKNASTVNTTGTTTINTEVDVTNASITLTPGVWELQYSASLGIERVAVANTVIARVRVTDSANTAESGTESALYLANANAIVAGIYTQQTITKRINLTASKTFKLRLTCSESSSVAICYVANGNVTGGITGDDATTYIRAVRVN